MIKSIMACIFIGIAVISMFSGITGETLTIAIISLCLAFIFLYLNEKEARSEADNSKKQKTRESNLISFLDQIESNKLYPFDNEYKKEKAVLIQKKYEFTGSVDEIYREALEVRQKISEETEKEYEKKKKTIVYEQNKKNENIVKYANLYGREKTIQMLNDSIEDLKKYIKAYESFGDIYAAAYTQDEKNWGLAGGIAEGIAGRGAGIIAASEVIAENEKIKSNNILVENKAKEIDKSLSEYVYRARKKLIRFESQLNEAKIKIVSSKYDSEQLYKMLKIELDNVKVEDCYISLDYNIICNEDLEISENVKANIDGSFVIEVFENDNFIEKTYAVLPMFGVTNEVSKINTVCANINIKKANDYKYIIKPNKLWIVER